jgi:hypothetical protein
VHTVRGSRLPGLASLSCLAFLLSSCGGGSSSSQNPVPAIQSVSPTAVSVGGPSFTLTVTGSNFVPTSVVQWNGVNQTTTYMDSAHLAAVIPASAITTSSIGNLPVTVTTPAPGGGNSNAASVLVEYPLPAITSLNPSGVVIGSPAFTLTVNGTNYVTGLRFI